jgi:hypothetical protein
VGVKEGVAVRGGMSQTLYAHMNKKISHVYIYKEKVSRRKFLKESHSQYR